MTMRSRAEVAALFEGFDVVEPGVVFLPRWRPDPGTPAADCAWSRHAFAQVWAAAVVAQASSRGPPSWRSTYLRRLPIHGLKLDRSIAEGLRHPEGADRTDELIVSTLITLARALDLPVTTEGIETALQLERLRSLGCDVGQG